MQVSKKQTIFRFFWSLEPPAGIAMSIVPFLMALKHCNSRDNFQIVQESYIMQRMARTILHIDLDAFFCAVEENQNPSLRGKAFAVGGKPDERGVVASCSYAARRMGVRSAMPMAKALKLSPRLIVVP